MSKEKRGGYRVGAGRPPGSIKEDAKVNLTIRVTPELKEKIKVKAKEEGLTVTELTTRLFNSLF